MGRAKLFWKLMVRPLGREPVRTALTVFAVALGVAVVLAIELAGQAATGSFHSSLATLTGTANLEITAAGGVPDEVVGKLSVLPYAIRISPRIEDFATLVDTKQTLPLIALDLLADAERLTGAGPLLCGDVTTSSQPSDKAPDEPKQQQLPRSAPQNEQNRTHPISGAAPSPSGDSPQPCLDLSGLAGAHFVWLGKSIGKKAGEHVKLLINDQILDYTVAGTYPDASGTNGAIVMDVAEAQRALAREGRVDRVMVETPEKPAPEEWQKRIAAALPEGISVRAAGTATAENRKMLGAFRWNLRLLSYIALVVGAFLIYNTISVSVVRRRAEIGITRALGAERHTVLLAFVGEAALFGAGGAALGLALGRGMATGAVKLMGATVNALYVSSRPGTIELGGGAVLLALTTGIGIAVISAYAPAREAAQAAPAEAMARGRREYLTRVGKRRDSWIAVGLAIAAGILSQLPPIGGKAVFGYVAALALVASATFAIPAFVELVLRRGSNWAKRLGGPEGLVASRSLASSLRRTSVLVGALCTAVAMMTSVGIMVGSFRETVAQWMENDLPADLYLRPGGGASTDRHPTISPELPDKIAALPGVASVGKLRAYEISFEGMPAELLGADMNPDRELRRANFLSGRSNKEVLSEVRGSKAVIVSEPFANKHHLKKGGSLTLGLGESRQTFRVADVAYDYGSERGYVLMDRAVMMRFLPDPAVTNLAVYVAQGASVDAVRREIEQASSGYRVLVFSNGELRTQAIRIFDRTFAITYALEAVAVLVAVMGVAGALLALVIDRKRELGVLRFLGAEARQIRKMIVIEAGLLGLLANAAGLALGFLLSLVLIYVINKQSFGWTIQFHWPVAVLLGGLTMVYAATLLSGLYPARVAVRMNPIEAIHEE